MSGADDLERGGRRDVVRAVLADGDPVEVVGLPAEDGGDEWASMVGEQGTVMTVTMSGVRVDFGPAVLTLPPRRLRRL